MRTKGGACFEISQSGLQQIAADKVEPARLLVSYMPLANPIDPKADA